MPKRDYFLIVDTETTMSDKVADFGAVVCDRNGVIVKQCAILIDGVFGVDALFYLQSEHADKLWSKQGKDRRFTAYQGMVTAGTRIIASIHAVNRWLDKTATKYNPMLTAYNLSFDVSKCQNTGIDLTMFSDRFCLWHAAYNRWAHTKPYRQFILDTHSFNPPTDLGNMSYKTNAEVMARFVLDNMGLEDEPHTALEDILYYELPILRQVIKKRSRQKLVNNPNGYNWRNVQLKDHFVPK